MRKTSFLAVASSVTALLGVGLACSSGGSGTSTPPPDAAGGADRTGVDARDGGADAPARDGSADARDAAKDTATDHPSDTGGDVDVDAGCTDAGSGKTGYTCPDGGTEVKATDDLASAVTDAGEGATLCIHGPHRITSTLKPKKNQTWIGVDTTASIDGSGALTGFTPASGMSGVWVYTGALATSAGLPHQNGVMSGTGASTVYACFLVSTYQDDVFYGEERVMRVLSTAELTGATLPAGQATTAAETGRFFFDYAHQQIYVTTDPSAGALDLATVDVLIDGVGIEGVTMSNLLVEKALDTAVEVGPSWRLTDMTIRYAHEIGASVGSGTSAAPTTLERVRLTNNGKYGLSGSGSWVTLEDSELSWNNIANHVRVTPGASGGCDFMTGAPGGYWASGAAKLVHAAGGSTSTPDLQIVGVESHHNVGNGFWTDVNDRYVLVQGGRYHHNEWVGYFHEIGCDIEITGVEADHNGTPIKNTGMPGYGIQISDSNNASVHDNVIHDNASGPIGLLWQKSHSGISGMDCVTPPPANDTDTSHVLMNDVFQNNQAYSCDPDASTGMEYGAGELIVARMNAFSGNAYHVPSTTGTWWSDPGSITWSAWNAIGLDTTGSVAAPCAYTAPPSCGK